MVYASLLETNNSYIWLCRCLCQSKRRTIKHAVFIEINVGWPGAIIRICERARFVCYEKECNLIRMLRMGRLVYDVRLIYSFYILDLDSSKHVNDLV